MSWKINVSAEKIINSLKIERATEEDREQLIDCHYGCFECFELADWWVDGTPYCDKHKRAIINAIRDAFDSVEEKGND